MRATEAGCRRPRTRFRAGWSRYGIGSSRYALVRRRWRSRRHRAELTVRAGAHSIDVCTQPRPALKWDRRSNESGTAADIRS